MRSALKHFYVVILAGGGGSRLWPISRSARPKQFLQLVNKKTLLRETFERLQPLVPPDRIYVTTIERYRDEVVRELPEVSHHHILVEPKAKSTAVAIGMAATVIGLSDTRAVVGTFASDHTVRQPQRFRTVVSAIASACSDGPYLGTIGIVPTKPHTGYGYIHRGKVLFSDNNQPIYQVKEFVEKPTVNLAQKYLSMGTYFWNASYFFFSVTTIMDAFRTHMPHLVALLARMEKTFGTPSWDTTIRAIYKRIAEVPIEYGIFEKAKNVLVIRGDFTWSDVGDWSTIYELLHKKDNANIVIGQHKTPLVEIDTQSCLISGNRRLIATIGLKDHVIIDSDDALLICPMDRTQQVRKIVEYLKKRHKRQFV